jgi:hypothetical protein
MMDGTGAEGALIFAGVTIQLFLLFAIAASYSACTMHIAESYCIQCREMSRISDFDLAPASSI